MRSVYSAPSLLDARMVADQLQREGIHAEIFGGYLQGGAGELPATGLVRVMVADEDTDRAARIIAEWERTTTERDNEDLNASSRAKTLAGFTLGLITGIAGTWLFVSLPEQPRQTLYYDYNGDRRVDGWRERVNERTEESRRDRNFDGVVDAWWYYDDQGRVARAERDDDFDGSAEFTLRYRNNQPHQGTVDANGDGVAEYRLHYEHGLLTRKEIMDPANGRLISRLHYRDGKHLEKMEQDTNGDGVVDTTLPFRPGVKTESRSR